MKNKSIISLFVFLLGFGVSTTSCEDMLTPDMDRYVVEFSGKDTVNFYLGILRNLQSVVEQNVLLAEVRSDLSTTTQYTSDSITALANFDAVEDGDNGLLNRAAYYKVINQCNFYLAKVDTLAKKNDIYYMRKEAAQVSVIRAWTYLQLVQNYGAVPFITRPVDNANTGWETNSPEGVINADNMVEKLRADLELAIQYEDVEGLPNYGTFESGKSGVQYAHRNLIFPARVVMADLYLAGAKSTADYEKAAMYYYDYLTESRSEIPNLISNGYNAAYSKVTFGGKDSYFPSVSSWTAHMFATSAFGTQTAGTEAITVIPSAANGSFGKVLTMVPQVYGFDPHSSNTTETEDNDEGEAESSTSGQVTIIHNYKNRQIAPSARYEQLNASQIYVYAEGNDDARVISYPEGLGDARFAGTAPLVETEEGRLRFIHKFGIGSVSNNGEAYSFSFRYGIPVYRVTQIYLRFAEALNRAGHPRYAFAALRNGFGYCPNKYTVARVNEVFRDGEQQVDKDGNPVVDKDGNPVYEQILVSCDLAMVTDSVINGNNFINFDAMTKAEGKHYMDFATDEDWLNVYGIHNLGCGRSYDGDTIFNYGVAVAKRMLDEESRLNGFEVAQFYKENGLDLDTTKLKETSLLSDDIKAHILDLYTETNRRPTVQFTGVLDEEGNVTAGDRISPVLSEAALQAEINAVETLLADEMALETAFEGWRFYDLVRIAKHKINAGDAYQGANWLAWLIARRNKELAPYENVGEYDATLYGKLLNEQNWYLPAPKY